MAVTNWLSPSANATTAGWTGAANVYAQDGVNATVTVTGGAETPYFRVYGFNDAGTALATLLTGATAVTQVEVEFYGRTASTPDYDYSILGNAPSGSPQSATAKNIGVPVSGTTSAYSPTIIWTTAQLSPLVVADYDANMGISGAWSSTASMLVTWDYVRMRLTYTLPGGGTQKYWWGGW